MKVQAFKTDCCKQLKEADSVYGVIFKPDLFDSEKSYITVPADKAQKHYCVDCYLNNVINPAELVAPKKKNADKNAESVKQYAYAFKKHLFYDGIPQM